VIPFRIQLRSGVPISEQIIYAAKRAIVSGQLHPGDPFPSVRVLSREAHINPNTAHKVITTLLAEGLIESRPGIGTVVAVARESTLRDRKDLLGRQVESLVVAAKGIAISREDLLDSISDHWQRLSKDAPATRPAKTNPKGDRSQ